MNCRIAEIKGLLTIFLSFLMASCSNDVPEGLAAPGMLEMSETASAYNVVMTCLPSPAVNVVSCLFRVFQGTTVIAVVEGGHEDGGAFIASASGLRQNTEYSWTATLTNGKDEITSTPRPFKTEKLPYDPVLWEEILRNFDIDGSGNISESERSKAKEFALSDLPLSSLSGIEELPYLERLSIGGNGLEVVDITALKNLEFLSCGRDNYERIIFDNPKLSYIYIIETPLKALDTSGLPGLCYLDSYNNPFENLSFKDNPRMEHIILVGAEMEELDLSSNPRFDIIFVRENENLRVLWLHPDCKPSSIDINDKTEIKYKR
ncbi:MAG: hypothetical protein IK145_04385 [Bacteroidales bacterium]|nr:hypothetical protein [Bacteroidales bacterium]